MSSKGAKRSRRIAGDAPEAPPAGGAGGAGGGGPASASSSDAPASSSAIVRSQHRSATAAADDAGSSGGALAPGITVEMSRFVEEQLRGVQRDMEARLESTNRDRTRELAALQRSHARELAAVNRELSAGRDFHTRELAAVHRELSAVRSDHTRLASENTRLSSDHARLASEFADLRYDNSHLCALVKSSIDHTEVDLAMVCRRYGSGLDAFREYRSVMSVLFNVHAYDLSEGVMRFFTTREARELRLVHSEFLDAVNATPWHDMQTVITGPVSAWRACFLNAQAARLGKKVVDADFVHLRGLRSLNMNECKGVSDAAFVNLRGIDSLRMYDCSQPSITAGAFTHLKGIQELNMDGCSLAVTTAASDLLREARRLIPSLTHNSFIAAIRAADVPECRRLLAARALGFHCWLYAGVTFYDLPAPASAHDIIATACMELLQVAIEVKSVGMVIRAARDIVTASLGDLGKAALVVVGAIPALVAALDGFGSAISVCMEAFAALGNIALTAAGRVACGSAGAARPIVSALKLHATSADVVKQAFFALANMSWNSSANVVSFVSLGAVNSTTAAFQKCNQATSLCCRFSRALRNIAHHPCGVEACLAAGAVPLLATAYAKDEPARVFAKAALRRLGYDSVGVLLPGL